MRRDTRPMTLAYEGATVTFDMPGWYCDASDESIHTGADMKVADRMLNRLKGQAQALRSAWQEGIDSGDAGPLDFAELREAARQITTNTSEEP